MNTTLPHARATSRPAEPLSDRAVLAAYAGAYLRIADETGANVPFDAIVRRLSAPWYQRGIARMLRLSLQADLRCARALLGWLVQR